LAAAAVVVNDPAEWSLLVKPAQASGRAGLAWRQGLQAMAEGGAGEVWPYIGSSHHRIARGTPEEDAGALRFQWDSGDSVYRALASNRRLRAILMVDKSAGRILAVRFLGRLP
jgi:hypothetical protein